MLHLRKIFTCFFMILLLSASFKVKASIPSEYDLYLENDQLKLYINKDSMAIKVFDKKTEYVWSSSREFSEDESLNKLWKNKITSGITVEYFNNKKQKPEYATLTGNKNTFTLNKKGKEIVCDITFQDTNISFQVVFSLDGNRLKVHVPYDKIKEDEGFVIKNILLFPFLGSTNQKEKDGYIVVPDGSGAIMEYGKQKIEISNPYQAKVYGVDNGMNDADKTSYPLSIPLFGIVNGVDKNGMYAHIKNGSAYATLNVYPSGVTTAYNWATFQFDYRQNFFQVTSSDGKGFTDLEKKKQVFDIDIEYTFLNNDKANYTGIAKDYQKKLVKNDILQKRTDDTSFLHLQILGSELFKTELGFKTNVYTSISDVKEIVEDLESENIIPMVEYIGTSKGGNHGSRPSNFPLEKKLGSMSDMKKMIQTFHDKKIPILFEANYSLARLDNKKINSKKDFIQKVDQQQFAFDWEFDGYKLELGILRLAKAKELFQSDLKRYEELGVDLSVTDTPSYLCSDYGSNMNREESVFALSELFKQDKINMAYYNPNEYLYRTMDKYFDMPMDNSNFLVFSKEIPFLQIVLKGYVDYFAPAQNASANPQNDLLKLIEYGAYPTFVLTKESPFSLTNTPSDWIFSSEFELWKDKVIQTEHVVKEALQSVADSSIIGHEFDQDISVTTYDNGVVIYVNYSNEAVKKNGIHIDAKSYYVDGVKE